MTDAPFTPDPAAAPESPPPEPVPGARDSSAVLPPTPPSGASGEATWAGMPEAPKDREVGLLRSFLFGREIAILEKLCSQYDDAPHNVKRVSGILSEAILLRSKSDDSLNTALEPVVDEILQTSLQKRKTDFVNVLYPLMGPTIRKSIAESFRSMMADFGKSMEMAFSWKGLRWRLEALRTGKSFSEIVLLRTLDYRVEQIYFIHGETGLVLSSLAHEGADTQDADMVSAMLTAIQDFVRDCFTGGGDYDLENLQMGEFTIHIEHSQKAYLACVVRGIPPTDFHRKMREVLEMLLIEFSEELIDFQGDTAPFAGATRLLEACMLAHYVEEEVKPHPFWVKGLPLFVALLVAIGCGGAYYAYAKLRDARHRAIAVLRAEPGLMIVHVQEKSGLFDRSPWEVIAFRDELANAPAQILSGKGMDPSLFTFKLVPFVSHDRSIILRRAKEAFSLPETVSMRLDEKGGLTFEGTAQTAWIARTREAALLLPGVKRVDMHNLRDPLAEEITRRVKGVEGAVIEFPVGGDTPIPSDQAKLVRVVDTLVELETLARKMGIVASLTIYGHADPPGSARRNYEISQSRARTVASLLYAKGSSMPVSIYGMGSAYPREEGDEARAPTKTAQASAVSDPASRRIEFRVHLSNQPAFDAENLLFR
jgi:OOP family OmpA-OmpF porin